MGLHKIRYNELWDGIAQTRYNVAFSINNVTVNMGKRNSVKSRLLVKNTDVCFGGCPCHMVHNVARKREIAFLELLPVLDLIMRI